MNATNIGHALWAVAMQVCIGLPTGNWWAGAAFGIAWFISREYEQRERKLTIAAGGKLSIWAPFFGWSLDAKLDAILPTVVCVLIALGMEFV